MALRTGEVKPWISSAGGIPLDRGLESVQVPERSRRDFLGFFGVRDLGRWGKLGDCRRECREVDDWTDGDEGGESLKWSKSGSSGKACMLDPGDSINSMSACTPIVLTAVVWYERDFEIENGSER